MTYPALEAAARAGRPLARLKLDRLSMVREERRDGSDDMLFSISAVVMVSNLPHLAELVRFAARFGAHGVILQRLRHEVKATWDEEITRFFTPAEIEPIKRLRAAHLSRRGTVFCCDCEYAPHLPARPFARVQGALKVGRRLVNHVATGRTRRRKAAAGVPQRTGAGAAAARADRGRVRAGSRRRARRGRAWRPRGRRVRRTGRERMVRGIRPALEIVHADQRTAGHGRAARRERRLRVLARIRASRGPAGLVRGLRSALPDRLDAPEDRTAVGPRPVRLCAMDGDLEQRRAGRRAHFMVSDDSGATWRIVHRFAADWSDAPERFLLLSRDPVEVLTDGTDRPCILRLPSAAR